MGTTLFNPFSWGLLKKRFPFSMSLVWISWSLRMVGGMICMKYADTREIPYEWFVISSTLSIDLLKLSLPWILNNTANVIVVPIIVLVIVISSAICPPMYYRRANSLLRLMENMLSHVNSGLQPPRNTILSLRNMEYCPMREYKKIWNRYQQKSRKKMLAGAPVEWKNLQYKVQTTGTTAIMIKKKWFIHR